MDPTEHLITAAQTGEWDQALITLFLLYVFKVVTAFGKKTGNEAPGIRGILGKLARALMLYVENNKGR